MLNHTVIQIVCSFCGKDMGQKDGEGVTGISHSICGECKKKLMYSIGGSYDK